MSFVARVRIALVAAHAACAPTPGVSTATATSLSTTPPSASSEAQSPSTSTPSAPPTSPTEVLAKDRATFDACYARARAANPNLGRTSVEITFTIDAEGKPTSVELQYRHRMDEVAKECLRDAALALRFPPSLAGKQSGTIAFTPPSK
jgi:hypothetical protein